MDVELDEKIVLDEDKQTACNYLLREMNENECQFLFTLDLPEGKCIGVQKLKELQPLLDNENHWLHARLMKEEIDYAANNNLKQNADSFLLGRLAMHQVLALLNCHDDSCNIKQQYAPILKDVHGRPIVPVGCLGSISHKKNTAVALVASDEFCEVLYPGVTGEAVEHNTNEEEPNLGVGIDIESTYRSRNVAKRILTDHEMQSLGQVDGVTVDEEILLRFSLKESFYKAIHPLVNQYVGFKEAEVTPHSDGTASLKLMLNSGKSEVIGNYSGHWRRVSSLDNEKYFLTSAKVARR